MDCALNESDFKKIGTAAFEEASKALSELLNQKVQLKLISVLVLSPIDVINTVGSELPTEVVAGYSEVEGTIDGVLLMVMPVEHAAATAKNLLERLLGSDILNEEMAFDLLKEITNIVFGAIVSTVYNKYGIYLKYSVPRVVIDNFIAILDNIALIYMTLLNELVVLNAEIESEEKLKLKLLFIPGKRRIK
ncbi:MAG: chemotaxis protein CheX [Desulfurococcales archaeon]|nr:chemotaxis protein CheX [Desulfurococcales archaeon]